MLRLIQFHRAECNDPRLYHIALAKSNGSNRKFVSVVPKCMPLSNSSFFYQTTVYFVKLNCSVQNQLDICWFGSIKSVFLRIIGPTSGWKAEVIGRNQLCRCWCPRSKSTAVLHSVWNGSGPTDVRLVHRFSSSLATDCHWFWNRWNYAQINMSLNAGYFLTC